MIVVAVWTDSYWFQLLWSLVADIDVPVRITTTMWWENHPKKKKEMHFKRFVNRSHDSSHPSESVCIHVCLYRNKKILNRQIKRLGKWKKKKKRRKSTGVDGLPHWWASHVPEDGSRASEYSSWFCCLFFSYITVSSHFFFEIDFCNIYFCCFFRFCCQWLAWRYDWYRSSVARISRTRDRRPVAWRRGRCRWLALCPAWLQFEIELQGNYSRYIHDWLAIRLQLLFLDSVGKDKSAVTVLELFAVKDWLIGVGHLKLTQKI